MLGASRVAIDGTGAEFTAIDAAFGGEYREAAHAMTSAAAMRQQWGAMS